jgi:hypothetical protein
MDTSAAKVHHRGSGGVKSFEGYRVQHHLALDPTKGGVRFHPADVLIGETAALAMWMIWKCALAGHHEDIFSRADPMNMRCHVVIGEGIKDEVPGLFVGEKVGNWKEGAPRFDIALEVSGVELRFARPFCVGRTPHAGNRKCRLPNQAF